MKYLLTLLLLLFLAVVAWAASGTDNFNTGTGALSGSWSVGYGTEQTPTVVGNAAECAIGLRCVASFTGYVPGANQYTQLVITQYTFPATNDGDVGPAVRMPAPTSFDGYFARCGNFSSATVSTIVQKRVAGASTTLGTETAAAAWAFGDVSRLEMNGTTWTLYRNGVAIGGMTGTDATHASGRGGMMINSAFASSSGETSRADDFEAGDLAAAPTARQRRPPVIIQ